MSQSLLESFDPFATHPFTNNSGVVPQPPMPSQYPILIPSPRNRSHFPQTFSSSPATSASPSSLPSVSPQTSPYVWAPQPRSRIPAPPPQSSIAQPIFVPFRQETSSPDLVLKKKSPSKSTNSPEKITRRS